MTRHPKLAILPAQRLLLVFVGSALAVACSAALPANTSSPAASPTREPSQSPGATEPRSPDVTPALGLPALTQTYSSVIYGYSVGFPAGWTVTPARGPWPSGAVLSHGDPRLDAIAGTAPAGEARFVAASQPVAPGTTNEAFGGVAGSFTCQAGDRLPAPVRVDNVDGLVTLDGCPSRAELGGLIYDVVVVTSGRGYDFTIDGAVTAADAAAWLATIRLTPSTAVDATPDTSASP